MRKVTLPIVISMLITTLVIAGSANNQSDELRVAQSLTPTDNLALDYNDISELQAFSHLLKYDPNCIAPCWWDVVLGSPDSTELTSIVKSQLDIGFRTYLHPTSLVTDYIFDYQYNEALPAFSIILREEAERINALEIRFFGVTDPSLSSEVNQIVQEFDYYNVFHNYGIPSEIWLTAGFNEALLLIYDNFGLAIYYIYRSFSNEDITEELDTLPLCFEQKHLFDFRIYSFADDDRLSGLEQFEYMQPIEDVSDYTPEEYVISVIEDRSSCIETLSELWDLEN
jgi:hypothetical protein